MKKRTLILAMVFVLAVSIAFTGFAAAADEGDYDPAEHVIALQTTLQTHPVVKIMIAGFENRARELGYDPIRIGIDEYDMPKVYQQTEAALAQYPIEGLVMSVADEGTWLKTKEYADMGIAVITCHTYLDGTPEDYPGMLAWVAASAEEYAKVAAEEIATQVGGAGTVAVSESAFNAVEDMAAASFAAYMAENYPDITVLEPMLEGLDTPEAIQRATALVQSNPDIVGAFSTTGAGASTWAGAIEATGKDICAIGMDYSEVNLDLVKDGKIHGLIAQPLYDEFAMGAELLDQYLRGDEIPFANLMDAPLITVDNVDDYYALLDKVG